MKQPPRSLRSPSLRGAGQSPGTALWDKGRVHLVGAGPGAADLLTLRAARLLESADVVFHDALVEPDVLALARRARVIAVGKRCGAHSVSQRFINKRLVDAAARHDVVVRLKGGDPMLFGRAHEEIDALVAAGVAVDVVPGVTAALAAAAELRMSLTRRGVARSVVLVTPRIGAGESAHAWAEVTARADTAAIYMGLGDARSVVAALTANGVPADRPLVLVEGASCAGMRHRTGTLAELPGLAATRGDGPALVLLGEACRQALAPPAGQDARGEVAA